MERLRPTSQWLRSADSAPGCSDSHRGTGTRPGQDSACDRRRRTLHVLESLERPEIYGQMVKLVQMN